MNKIAKLFVTVAAIVAAALCLQSCEKQERENKLMLDRENTFLGKRDIMSFYLNGNICFDLYTWDRFYNPLSLLFSGPYKPVEYWIDDDTVHIYCYIGGEDNNLRINKVRFEVPIDNGELKTDDVKVDLGIKANGHEVYYYEESLPVSSIDFQVEDYDKEHISGRFSFNVMSNSVNWLHDVPISQEELQANGGALPELVPCHDVPDISVHDGLFYAHYGK
ncbi:MAG: hypothetical protein MJZ09_02095 [Bacteroidales bacterium]|nr:hypothetical protein [Bacteroidales bacterium]